MACYFNGTSYPGDGANFYDPTTLRNITTKTLSAWILPFGWGEGNYGRIISKSYTTFSEGWLLFLANGGGPNGTQTLAFSQFRSIIDCDVRGANYAITLNEWQHVAVTYQSSGTVLYVNGQAIGTVNYNAGSGGESDDTDSWLLVGQQDWSYDREFDGLIEDVRIWNRVLSASEISALWKARGGDSIHYGEIARWPLNELPPATVIGTGTLRDISNNKNDGDSLQEDFPYAAGIVGRRKVA